MTRRSRVAHEICFYFLLKIAKRPKFSDFSGNNFFFGIFEVDFYETLHRKSSILTDAPEVVDSTILVLQKLNEMRIGIQQNPGSAIPGILAAVDTTELGKAFLNKPD